MDVLAWVDRLDSFRVEDIDHRVRPSGPVQAVAALRMHGIAAAARFATW